MKGAIPIRMVNHLVVTLSLLKPLDNLPKCNESAFDSGTLELLDESP